MATHCIFFKKFQCLNCNNSCNICPCNKYVKIQYLSSLFQKENRTENVKTLQINCINNGVTNGLNIRKNVCKTALYGKINERRDGGGLLIGAYTQNIGNNIKEGRKKFKALID